MQTNQPDQPKGKARAEDFFTRSEHLIKQLAVPASLMATFMRIVHEQLTRDVEFNVTTVYVDRRAEPLIHKAVTMTTPVTDEPFNKLRFETAGRKIRDKCLQLLSEGYELATTRLQLMLCVWETDAQFTTVQVIVQFLPYDPEKPVVTFQAETADMTEGPLSPNYSGLGMRDIRPTGVVEHDAQNSAAIQTAETKSDDEQEEVAVQEREAAARLRADTGGDRSSEGRDSEGVDAGRAPTPD